LPPGSVNQGVGVDGRADVALSTSNETRSRRGMHASSSTLATIQPVKRFNLNGAWRDSGMGACHLITQTGADLKITNFYPATDEVRTQGERVPSQEITARCGCGPCGAKFGISNDGKVLRASMSGATGRHPSMWQYVGASCSGLKKVQRATRGNTCPSQLSSQNLLVG
jgi:hypothetical protein